MQNNSQKTILLTGAGGAALPYIIKRLKAHNYRVLAADMDESATGFYFADKGFVIPAGLSDDFLKAITDICKQEKVDAFIPLVDEELINSADIEQLLHIPVITPEKEFIKICLDKYKLMQALKEVGINVPETKLISEDYSAFRFPLIIKPKTGRGSRGIKILKTSSEAESYINNFSENSDDYIIQECIEGTEFTVSVLVWRDGEVQAVVPKEIICKRGITRAAVSRRNDKIDEICRQVQQKLKANGPFNVQLMLDKNGNPFIFEINPRYSTSISLTIASGVDELCEILEQELENTPKKNLNNWQEGVVLIRQTLDEFITEDNYNLKKNNINFVIGKTIRG